MSPCDRHAAGGPTGTFHVISDPIVEIIVHDAMRTVCGRAEGQIELRLPPGLYRVRLERAGAVLTEVVDHEQLTCLPHPGPALRSPVPFAGAETSQPYYVQAARSCSVKDTAPPLGDGPHSSRLFIFVRRAARDAAASALPSEPIAIHDVAGRQLAAISRKTAEIDQRNGYIAYSGSATPGTYRLRGTQSRRDVAIGLPPGRAAQVFIADTGTVRFDELRLALVRTAAFDPASPIWSAMESVLTALRAPDRALPTAIRKLLPTAAGDDLCFAIAAAHVAWRAGDRDLLGDILDGVGDRRELPDLAILDALHRGRSVAAPDGPPLLRASLVAGLTRPEIDAGAIAPRSALDQAARTQLHDSVWCTWSARGWDAHWIEPTVEQLQRRGQSRVTIARSLVLPPQTVAQAQRAIEAATPGPGSDGQIAIDGYRLDAMLGRGVHSTVYRATRTHDGREVALKLIAVPDGEAGCARAMRSVRMSAPIAGPSVVAPRTWGVLRGHTGVWLELDLCRGSLLDLMSEANAPLALPRAHRIIIDALAVLEAFHDRGIVHDAITPANLLLRDDDTLAIADRATTAQAAGVTAQDAALSEFTAPERAVDHDLARWAATREGVPGATRRAASDVWAMAATYYFLLTLDVPRDDLALPRSSMTTAADAAVSLAAHRPDLPPRLVRCIDRALSRTPAARPRNARAFRSRLAAIRVEEVAPVRSRRSDTWLADLADLVRLHAARGAVAMAGLASVLVAVLLWRALVPGANPSCESLTREDDQPTRARVCMARYAETDDERDLAAAAQAYLIAGDLGEASRHAESLLRGTRRGDGHQILGYVALLRGELGDAKAHARDARGAHVVSVDLRGLASDIALMSWAQLQTGELAEAQATAEEARDAAAAADDAHGEVLAQLARHAALRAIGELENAESALSSAIARATEPCDVAWTRVTRALSQREAGRESLAMAELQRAERANRRCASQDIALQTATSAAWLLRRPDRTAALAQLDAASHEQQRYPDPSPHRFEALRFDGLLLRGYLAADIGKAEAALGYFAEAERAGAGDVDWAWQVERARAELAELAEDLSGAEQHYRRAVELVTLLRHGARGEMAYFVARHRGPFDGLIGLLTRTGRWNDALNVVLQLDASDMLQAAEDALVSLERAPAAIGKGRTSPDADPHRTPAIADLVSAWSTRDLVIVIAQSPYQLRPAAPRVLVMRLAHGELRGEALADADTVRRWADDLYVEPGNRVAAQALARLLVPRDGAGSLDILAIGSLGKIPLAALRDADGALITARRPIRRVLSLWASEPAAAANGAPVVIADPRGDLPSAAEEGAVVVEKLGADAQLLGSHAPRAATRARLWAARDAYLLHIAASTTRGRPNKLNLADGSVEPAELVAHRVAPRIAVLATGSSASASDDGRGSIAAALLQAGTQVVIATDRSVADRASLAIMRGFYAQLDWRSDAPRALARVQQALDTSSSHDEAAQPRSWAAFTVLGRPPTL